MMTVQVLWGRAISCSMPCMHATVHAMHGQGQHKQHVIDDDDIAMEADRTGGEGQSPRINCGAEARGGNGLHSNEAATKTTTGLDRLAALSDVFSNMAKPESQNATETNVGQSTKATTGFSLLDAMMDDDGEHGYVLNAPMSKFEPHEAHPSQQSADRTAFKMNAEASQNYLLSTHMQPPSATSTVKQHLRKQDSVDLQQHDVLPNEPADRSTLLPKQCTDAAPRKISLKDKMRALGMKV